MSARLPTKQELREAHGTPDEFESAVWLSHADLFVTTDEALKAIREYRYTFNQATE